MNDASPTPLDDPRNRAVLEYLGGHETGATVALRSVAEVADPYLELGAHPDVVTRLWDELGAALPVDCRAVVHAVPALVHPQTGVVFALALGTSYVIRVSDEDLVRARAAGAQTQHTYTTTGVTLDSEAAFGRPWIFGAWLEGEPGWCQGAFRLAAESAS